MKKLFVIFSLIVFAFGLEAQNGAVDYTLKYSESYVYFAGSDADTIGIGDSTFTYTVEKSSLKETAAYAYFSLDSVGGTAANVVVNLESRVTPRESWNIRETVTYAGQADTTFILESDSTHKARYWRANITGQDDGFNMAIDNIDFYITEE